VISFGPEVFEFGWESITNPLHSPLRDVAGWNDQHWDHTLCNSVGISMPTSARRSSQLHINGVHPTIKGQDYVGLTCAVEVLVNLCTFPGG